MMKTSSSECTVSPMVYHSQKIHRLSGLDLVGVADSVNSCFDLVYRGSGCCGPCTRIVSVRRPCDGNLV